MSWLAAKAQSPSGVGMPHALWMIDQLWVNHKDWPVTKVHRWFGYLQCLLVISNIYTLEEIRNQSRGIDD